MSRSRPLAILVAAGILVIGALIWLVHRSTQGGQDGAAGPLHVATPSEPDAEAAVPDEGAELVEEAELADVDRAEGRVPERRAQPIPPGDPQAQWLAGWVRLPEGTPADERIVVLAVDRPRKLRELAGSPSLVDMAWDHERQRTHALVSTAQVEADGRFRIELPADAEVAHLALAGRYLFSMATTEVTLPALGSPTLIGELGGWITGTLLPPPDPSPLQSDFEWIQLELGPDLSAGIDTARVDSVAVTRQTEAAADGRFEFRGVPGSGGYGISVEHGHLAAVLHLGLDPEPGEHLELDLQMVRGATLRGRVADALGAPVADADVEARYRSVLGESLGALRETVSEADGSFELPHVALGKVDVVARSAGLREGRLELEDELRDGMELGGLTVVLEQGASLEGWVAFPDGSPAEGVQVHAGPDLSQLGGMQAFEVVRTRGGSATTDANGHFELSGLSESRFTIRAYATIEAGEHAGLWGATEKSVEPGDEALRMVLAGLVTVSGRVTDDASAPVSDFTVRSTLQGSGAMFGLGAVRRMEVVHESEDGSFRLQGLSQDTWEIEVIADDYASSEVQVIALPQPKGAPELLFVLEPAAAVAGRVVDTGGAPVAGARVSLELDIGTRLEAQQGEGVPEVFTDVDGLFLMGGIDPGMLSLVASFEGFAASEPVPCQVVSGEVTEGIELRLRVGGTLTGLVYDEDGELASNCMVIAQRTPSFASQHMLTTDARGEFRIEHLEPGSWQVIATANFISGDTSLTSDDMDMGELIGSMKMSAAEIVDGEETHVVLGAPPADPVLLRGLVTHAAQPVAGAMVSLLPEGTGAMSAVKMKVTDDSGRFEVQLDQPGAYLITVQTGIAMGRQNSVEYLERVPEEVEQHELEIELPGGRISGRVFGFDGSALAACRVTVHGEGGVAFGSFMGGNYAELTTDAAGSYDVRFLRAGTYTVAAGGVPLGGMLGGQSEGGRAVRSGVRLAEGEWLDSLDFRLEEPSELSGSVLEPSGAPVTGASVFVRDDAGHLLERFSLITTDAAGRFTYPGLAPGRYRISAREGARASQESAPVDVLAGGTGEAVVTLLQGTVLRVAVVDESGADVSAKVSVTDSEGREFAGMLSMNDVMEGFGEGFSSKEQRVGPLCDGKYTVTATHSDGRKKARSVRLRGQGERKVKLRLN